MKGKSQAIKYLSALSEIELIDLLYELFENIREEERWGENWHIETYIIGHSISTSLDPVAYTEILARPKSDTVSLLVKESATGFFESGKCPLCKTIITSCEKIATCPICKSDVECT